MYTYILVSNINNTEYLKNIGISVNWRFLRKFQATFFFYKNFRYNFVKILANHKARNLIEP